MMTRQVSELKLRFRLQRADRSAKLHLLIHLFEEVIALYTKAPLREQEAFPIYYSVAPFIYII